MERRLSGALANRTTSAFACAFVFAAVFQTAHTLVALSAYWAWPLSRAPPPSWLNLPQSVLLLGLGSGIMLLAARLAPRWGWAGLGLLGALAIFSTVLIPPLALIPLERGDQLSTSSQGAPLLAFLRKGGFNAERVYRFESADPAAVDVEGLGPFHHVAAARGALTAANAQTYAALGHLLGHYRHHDLERLALLWSGLLMLFLMLVWALLKPAVRAAGAKDLAVIGLAAWGAALLSTLTFNAFDQAINYKADAFALEQTHDVDGLSRWLISTEAKDEADPSPLEAVVFFDHPPLLNRLVQAQRWRLLHHL